MLCSSKVQEKESEHFLDKIDKIREFVHGMVPMYLQ